MHTIVCARKATRRRADHTIGAITREWRRLPWATKLERTENRIMQ